MKRSAIRLLTLGIAAAALFAIAAVLLPHSPEGIRRAVGAVGWAAPLLFVLGWGLLTPALFSGTVLAAAAGLLFGPVAGTGLGIAGATLGGLLSFWIARYWGKSAFQDIVRRRMGRLAMVQERVRERPFRAVLVLRIMPGMPATWLNYAIGLTPVRAITFAAASALGGAPRVFIYAGLGGSLSHASPLVTGACVLLFVVLTVGGVVTALRERRHLRAAPGARMAAATGAAGLADHPASAPAGA